MDSIQKIIDNFNFNNFNLKELDRLLLDIEKEMPKNTKLNDVNFEAVSSEDGELCFKVYKSRNTNDV